MSTDGAASPAERRNELIRRRLAEADLLHAPAPRPDRPDPPAQRTLSPGQQRMWSIQQLDPGTVGYNVTIAIDITGHLDPDLLGRAVQCLVARHDILRTTYRLAHERVVQVVADDLPAVYDRHDIAELAADDRAARLDELAGALAGRPFDLSADTPLRVGWIRTGEETGTLIVVAHHIVWDDATTAVFFGELMDDYRQLAAGRPVRYERAAHQFSDIAAGARGADESGLAYWRTRLDPLPPLVDLPGLSGGAGGPGRERSRKTRPGTGGRVREFARREGASTYMVLFAAVSALLHTHTGARDFLVGAPVVNRDFSGAERVVGYLGNTIPLRAEIDPHEDFRSLLARCRTTCLAGYTHQYVELDDIARTVSDQRSPGGGRLFNVVLSLRSPMLDAFRRSGFGATRRHVPGTDARFDLTLAVEIDGDELSVEANYPAGRTSDEQVDGLLDRLDELLDTVLADPGVSILESVPIAAADRRRVVREWNDTAAESDIRLLPERFTAQAGRSPDALAVVTPDASDAGELTYRELDIRANRLARQLARMGIGPENIVALAVPRSPAVLVAALGILAAGAAYLPVDPSYPPDRVRLMLGDARPDLVVTVRSVAGTLPHDGVPRLVLDDAEAVAQAAGLSGDTVRDSERVAPLHPDHPAYIIYTSGSTGTPKGVVVTHRAVSNHLDWAVRRFTGLGGRTPLHSSISFDFTVTPLFGTLLRGGTLELCDDGPDALATARGPATFLKITPSHLPLLPAVSFATEGPRTVVIAGEALHAEALAGGLPPAIASAAVINEYGPTETTVGATLHEIVTDGADAPVSGPVPIGRPVSNTRCYVLDPALRPVPAGSVGELYIGGVQVARGYLRRPGQTAPRFVADPFDESGRGARLYRTGDRARWSAEGALEFLGRVDDQVKIRGFRVEPAEIESVLTRHPAVARAVVVGRSDGPGGMHLAAYAVLHDRSEADIDGAALRDHLARALPEHMVPAGVQLLGELPLSPSGKIERRALPALDFTATATATRAPAGAAEEILARIFAEVLHRDSVGVTDSFLEIGGDSILTIQLVGRARKAGLKILPKDVFEYRTIEALAAFASRAAAPEPRPVAERAAGAVEPSPIMRSFAERGALGDRHRMSLLLDIPPLAHSTLVGAVAAVMNTHDALRSRLVRGERPHLMIGAEGSGDAAALIRRIEVPELPPEDVVAAELAAAAERLDPENATMAQFVWFDAGPEPGRLLLVLHHLVVDGVSLRILVEDLAAAARALAAGAEPAPAPAGTSLRSWARGLADRASSRANEYTYWESVLRGTDSLLGTRRPDPAKDIWSTVETVTVALDDETTGALLDTVPQAFFGSVEDVLLTAFGLAVAGWSAERGDITESVPVLMEGHGREESAVPGADLSRTIGWFTTQYPVRLDFAGIDIAEASVGGPAAGDAVKRVKEHLRSIPDHGIGHGVLRYLDGDGPARLGGYPGPQLGFNYLGRMDAGGGDWSIADGGVGAAYDPEMPVPTALVVNAVTEVGPAGKRLTAHWMYAGGILDAADMRALTARWTDVLDGLIRHAAGPGAGGHTPSDLSLVSLDQGQLDALEAKWRAL
ncbi:amino acid adenylation domain-containing protein [Nocardia sp. NPDC003963]